MSFDPTKRALLIAVDPNVRGMSRLADMLEAEPILPYRAALRQRVTLEKVDHRDRIGVVVPMTYPETILEAARAGVHRIAALHPPGLELSGRKAAMVRAAYAVVDLTLTSSLEIQAEAVAAGADPDRMAMLDDHVVTRLFNEHPRRSRRGGFLEGAVSLGLDLMEATGVIRALEIAAPDRGVNVVNYHRVLPIEELASYCRPQMAISAPTFGAQLEQMAKRRGFAPVERLRHQDAKDKVAITFDDGYEDNFRVALPMLETFSAPACIFVVTGLIGQPDALWWDRVGLSLFAWWKSGAGGELPSALPDRATKLQTITAAAEARSTISDVLSDLNLVDEPARAAALAAAEGLVHDLAVPRTMLTWEEVAALHRAGISFGSHTKSHVPLDELPLATAKTELLGSHDDLDAQIGRTKYRTTALPRGRLGELTKDDLEAQFDTVMTTEPGVNRVDDDNLFIKRRDGRMLTLAGRHHPAKLRLELTGIVDHLRRAYEKRRPTR